MNEVEAVSACVCKTKACCENEGMLVCENEGMLEPTEGMLEPTGLRTLAPENP